MLGGQAGPCHTSRVLATRTFLFSDLRDYTRFVETHGDVAATALIGDYRRIVRAEIAKHEGAEVKTEGDSFYVVFPGARAAVAAAQGILREAERYSHANPERPLRVGIALLRELAGELFAVAGDKERAAMIAPLVQWLRRRDGTWYLRRIETWAAERGIALPA